MLSNTLWRTVGLKNLAQLIATLLEVFFKHVCALFLSTRCNQLGLAKILDTSSMPHVSLGNILDFTRMICYPRIWRRTQNRCPRELAGSLLRWLSLVELVLFSRQDICGTKSDHKYMSSAMFATMITAATSSLSSVVNHVSIADTCAAAARCALTSSICVRVICCSRFSGVRC